METLKRNWKELCVAFGDGDVTTIARKVARSVEILRERNKLSDLEAVVLRRVEQAANDLL